TVRDAPGASENVVASNAGEIDPSSVFTVAVNVSFAEPTLVKTIALVTFAWPPAAVWKLIDEGTATRLFCIAPSRSSFPVPLFGGAPGEPSSGVASFEVLFTSSERYCGTVSPGLAAINDAMLPVTNGAARLVPASTA